MNALDESKVKDILKIENIFANCIQVNATFKDLVRKLDIKVEEGELSVESKKSVQGFIYGNGEDVIEWNSDVVFNIYSKLFKEASSGKLNINNGSFLEKYVGGLYCIFNEELNQAMDVVKIREKITQYMEQEGYNDKFVFDFLLATTEAANNAIVHNGTGFYMMLVRENYIYSYISDRGQGIPVSTLASAIFKKDFSTKNALGAGYRIILSKADNIYIKYKNGVKVLLEFEVPKNENQ